MINKRKVDRILPELQRINNQEIKPDEYILTPLQEYIDAATEYIIGAFREFVSINDPTYNLNPYSFDSIESYAGYLTRLISILKDYNMGSMLMNRQYSWLDQPTPKPSEDLSFDEKEIDEIANNASKDNVEIYLGIVNGLNAELAEVHSEIKEFSNSFQDDPYDGKVDPYSDEFQAYLEGTI